MFGPLHTPNSLPVPLSVRVHKYQARTSCRTLWWDEALGQHAQRCPDCHERLDFAKGHPRTRSAVQRRTRVGLDAEGVAIDEKLFRRDALVSGLVLTGWVSGPAVDAFTIAGEPVEQLWLGGGRTTGGLAKVRIDPAETPEVLETDERTVILRLATPAIFIDAAGLPASQPDLADLRAALGVTTVRVEQQWTRWGEEAGWHAASNLAKPTERTVAAGSTYLLRCNNVPTPAALSRLRARGLGLRRREGFGALCPPLVAPVTLRGLTGRVAALRGLAVPQLQPLLDRLRARRPALDGAEDGDHALRNLPSKMPADLGAALQVVLDIDDGDLYDSVLRYLETGVLDP